MNSKESKTTDNELTIIAIVISLLFIPLILSIILARFIFVAVYKAINKKYIYLIITFLFFTICFFALIFYLFYTKSHSQKINLDWYDYVFPFSSEIKIFISLTKGNLNLATDIPLSLLGSFTFSIILFFISWPIRTSIYNGYLNKIKIYKAKLKNDEVVKNPQKLSMFLALIFWYFSINIHNSKANKKKNESINNFKNFVMLNKEVAIPTSSLSRHLAIIGTTGTGKTETAFKFIKNSLKNHKPTFFIDGKGDKEKIRKLYEFSQKNKIPFYLFKLDGRDITYSNESNSKISTEPYNPFSIKKEGVLVDIIMSLFDYKEEHYRAGAQVYVDIMINTMIKTATPICWKNIMFYLDKNKLIHLLKKRYHVISNVKSNENNKIVINKVKNKNISKNYSIDLQQLNNIDPKSISGFHSRIGMYYNATRNTINSEGFSIRDVIENNALAVFSLDSLEYQKQAKAIGNMIVNDLKAHADINEEINKKTLITLDEFDVFASETIIHLLNKTRSKGYEVILSFQSISDLSKISNDFKNQVIENTNNKIVHRINDPQGAEYISSVLGTKKVTKRTYVEEGSETTGRQSIRVVDQFIAHPNSLKYLKRGEVYIKYIDENGNLVTPEKKIKIDLNI